MKSNLVRLCPPGLALLLAFNASAQAIIQIASTFEVSFFVKTDGSLWRGDAVHERAKRTERINRVLDEAKNHPGSSQQGFRAIREALTNHIFSFYFEPIDLIVSNGVTAVAVNGFRDTFFIKSNGSLWAMGRGGGFNSPDLGTGTYDTHGPDNPIQIVSSGVVAVACGVKFTLFLKDDGSLWGFGMNEDGQLGDGTENNRAMLPIKIVSGDVIAIAAGDNHSLFIKRDGSLWGTGDNSDGQLGLGTSITHALRPVEIVASDVVSAAAGGGHSLFIKRDGSLWAMGWNDRGQIGDCTTNWSYQPKKIVSNHVAAVTAGDSGSLFLREDGSLWAMGVNWGNNYGEGIEFISVCPTEIFGANKSALVAGYYYNAKLKTCVSLWAGKFNNQPAGVAAANNKTGLRSNVASFPGYNLLAVEQLQNGDVRLTYFGDAGVKYALERSSSLNRPNWISLVTNTAPSEGMLVITNTPDTTANNFWRIRSVP